MRKYKYIIIIVLYLYSVGIYSMFNDSNIVRPIWRTIFNVGYGNYYTQAFADYKYGNLNGYRVYGRLDANLLVKQSTHAFFFRFGGALAYTTNVTLGLFNLHIGLSNEHKYKKIYSQFYVGFNFASKIEKEYNYNTSTYPPLFSGLNFNSPLLGYDVGIKINNFHSIELRTNILAGPVLSWEHIGGHLYGYDNVRYYVLDLFLGFNYVYYFHSKSEKPKG